MLRPYRVLDLTDERGLLCGQILGDLGADVIQSSRPAARRRAGSARSPATSPHPERSLFWWALHAQQAQRRRSISTTPTAARSCAGSPRGADFLIESDAPGHAWRRAASATRELPADNPALVYVSITPFGQDGPKAALGRRATSSLLAAGGPLVLTGDDDRPPVRLPVPQAYLHAAAEAAVARADRAPRAPAHPAAASTSTCRRSRRSRSPRSRTSCAPPSARREVRRMAGGIKHGALIAALRLSARRDGYVSITFLFGSAIGPFTRRLMEWVHEEGVLRRRDARQGLDRLHRAARGRGEEPIAEFERVKALIAAFTAHEDEGRAARGGARRAPADRAGRDASTRCVASPQLAARDYWQTCRAPSWARRRRRIPARSRSFARRPIRYRRRAPRLGEHTARGPARRAAARRRRPCARRRRSRRTLPLADVKVLDFMWAMAGPVGDARARRLRRHRRARRVDAAHRLCRTLAPFLDGEPRHRALGLLPQHRTPASAC